MTKDKVPKSKIPEAIDALRALGGKELDDIPARSAIRKMRRQIERVLRLGYSYEDVSKTLAGLDINIGAERIRYLLGEIRRSTRKSSSAKSSSSILSMDDAVKVENSDSSSGNGQSRKRQKSSSKSVKSVLESSSSTTTTKNSDETQASEYPSFSRPAFVPQLISDEDL
ncbi:hypothetical protein H6G80_31755 [Nostoc sp. FACHB-87]|uniref:hypothetical protein n=1 Tax=Nostocaceae TaxID=1162 RepID=UPI00168232B3|nr:MULTISPECIES: hypothetical protein [Nostocaceae]MBD2458627.1 hypothetical protein [Nostoc sp. FACHB-87]MBD2479680.1 hypothetical protein [Anabaena sp. FACHB-83]